MEIPALASYVPPESLAVVEGPRLRSGTQMICGFMPAGMLLANYEIPYFNYTTKTGYQRPAQPSRINQLAFELQKDRVDLPTGILLNLRSKAALKSVKHGQFFFSGNTLPLGKFYVVDGQHRVLAFVKAVADGWAPGLKFPIPFTCMLGADENEEMEQFYTVNSTAKAVRTDLAFTILKRRSEHEDGLMESLQEKGRDWQVNGQALVERLASESPVWRGRVRFPAMEITGTIIPSASMVSSLKPVIASSFFRRLGFDQQLKVLNAFWEGVRNSLREAFDQPSNYAIQKGIGVTVLHVILPEIVEIVRDRGDSTTEASSYVDLMSEALTNLSGENRESEMVHGVDFWLAGTKGAAGSYSSSAGRRTLLAKIRTNLPKLEVQ